MSKSKNDPVKPHLAALNEELIALRKSLRGAAFRDYVGALDGYAGNRQRSRLALRLQATLLHSLQALRRGRVHPGGYESMAKLAEVTTRWGGGWFKEIFDRAMVYDAAKRERAAARVAAKSQEENHAVG